MAIKCPGCNKFAGLEMQDPEVEDLEVSEDGEVTCTVRLVRVSSCCNEDMKEATLELSAQVDLEGHGAEGEHELEVEETSVEPLEEGGGRYAKSYYGATVHFTVTCSCGDLSIEGEMSDKVAASAMEEMV